jgi:hypothetical protein
MIDYNIYDATGKTIGHISNIYNGCLMELCTNQDKFGLQLPKNLSIDHKKLLINAPIYIDFLRYERFI